jgi:hypothetical protein
MEQERWNRIHRTGEMK